MTVNTRMRLVYLPANAAYVFTYGDEIIRLEQSSSRFFDDRASAVNEACHHGLLVARNGDVVSDPAWRRPIGGAR